MFLFIKFLPFSVGGVRLLLAALEVLVDGMGIDARAVDEHIADRFGFDPDQGRAESDVTLNGRFALVGIRKDAAEVNRVDRAGTARIGRQKRELRRRPDLSPTSGAGGVERIDSAHARPGAVRQDVLAFAGIALHRRVADDERDARGPVLIDEDTVEISFDRHQPCFEFGNAIAATRSAGSDNLGIGDAALPVGIERVADVLQRIAEQCPVAIVVLLGECRPLPLHRRIERFRGVVRLKALLLELVHGLLQGHLVREAAEVELPPEKHLDLLELALDVGHSVLRNRLARLLRLRRNGEGDDNREEDHKARQRLGKALHFGSPIALLRKAPAGPVEKPV